MIDLLKTLEKKNVEKIVGRQNGKKSIFTKFVYSFLLLEQLNTILEGKHYVFKGGTSLLLLFQESSRFSIDIDISMEEEQYQYRDELTNIFKSKIRYPFTNVTRDSDGRIHGGRNIKASHYRFYYKTDYEVDENYVLLDVVFQNIQFSSKAIKVDSPYIIQNGEPAIVNTIDPNDLLGDKLTAFAPNTIGVKYTAKNQFGRPKSCEIIKQMFDCSFIINKISKINEERVARIYNDVGNYQIIGESNKQLTISRCLFDTLKTCEMILSKGSTDKEKYNVLINGLISFNDYKIGESVTLIDLQRYAINISLLVGHLMGTLSPSVNHENKIDYLVRTGIKEKELLLLDSKERIDEMISYLTIKPTI